MPSPMRYAAGVLLAVSLLLSGCGGSDDSADPTTGSPAAPPGPSGPSPYTKLWSSTGMPVTSISDASNVEVTDAVTIVGGVTSLEAADTETGKMRWSIDTSKLLKHDPGLFLGADSFAAAGDDVIAPVHSRRYVGVAAFSLSDGAMGWTSLLRDRSGTSLSKVVGVSRGVVVWTRSGVHGEAPVTTAIRARDGRKLWQRPGVDAVAVSGDTVVGHHDTGRQGPEAIEHPGRPLGLDIRTGSQRWQAKTAGEVGAVSGDWVFASDSHDVDHVVSVAYALSDGHSVDAGDGGLGWTPTVRQVRPMGDAVVWATTGSSIRYHVLADGSSSPRIVDVGLQASVVPYTLVGKRLLAGAYGEKPALATYDLDGRKTAPDLPGHLIAVNGDYLVLAEGPGAGTYFSVYRIG